MKTYKQLNPEEVKTMNLDILSEVADFCEKNGLRYYLYYGTLIGAIRHNGYIPWDDDVRIIMPRPDYERFLKIFNEWGSKYVVLEDRITPGYHTPFAKVHNPKTVIKSEFSNEMSFGVFIDIFPFDGVKDDSQINKARVLKKLLSAKCFKWWKGRTLASNMGIYFFKALLFAVPVRLLLKKIRENAMLCAYDDSEYVDYVIEGTPTRVFRKYIEGGATYHVFEGRKYRIPCGYDACLKSNYGDYMKLPPKEEQVGHPQIAYWID